MALKRSYARSSTITIRVNSVINHYPIFSENAAGKKNNSSKLRMEKHRTRKILRKSHNCSVNCLFKHFEMSVVLFTYFEISTICLHILKRQLFAYISKKTAFFHILKCQMFVYIITVP